MMPTQLRLGLCQRWRDGRDHYRPAGECIRTDRFGVEPIGFAEAKAFVVAHHYSHAFVYAIQSYGLFEQAPLHPPTLVGVVTFATPSNQNTMPRWGGLPNEHGTELARLVLLDRIPANAESWFVTRALRLLKEQQPRLQLIVSYSDPLPRFSLLDHRIIFPGHIGTVYQALNAIYAGRADKKILLLSPDGRSVPKRILNKIRAQENGWQNATRTMELTTGIKRHPGESGESYLNRALPQLRRVPHPGNHTYLFPLGRNSGDKRRILQLPAIQDTIRIANAYPKHTAQPRGPEYPEHATPEAR